MGKDIGNFIQHKTLMALQPIHKTLSYIKAIKSLVWYQTYNEPRIFPQNKISTNFEFPNFLEKMTTDRFSTYLRPE